MTTFKPHEAPAKDLADLPLPRPERPVGRDEVLKDIYGMIRANQAVLIHGDSGLGKTSLAAALAAAYTQQPGGVLWLSGETRPLGALLARIGRAYGIKEISNSEKPEGMAGAVASTLAQNKPFIVLDDFNDALVLQQFIDKCVGNLPLLILSENALSGSWQTVALSALNTTDGVALFKQKAGINVPQFDADIASITTLLDNQPFPLSLAARAMVAAKQPPSEFAKVLVAIAQSVGKNPPMIAIAASYRALNNALQGLVLMLGATFKGEASAEFLSLAAGVPAETIDQAMTILSQLYLAEKFTRYGQSYYRLHKLVYQFAQATLKGSNRLEGLQAKVKETVLAYAKKYGASGLANHDKLATEIEAFIATAQVSSGRGERDVANTLVTILLGADDFAKERGYVYELLKLRELGSGFTTAFPAYPQDTLPTPEQLIDDSYTEEDLYEDDEDIYDEDDDLGDDDLYEDADEEPALSLADRLLQEDDDFDDDFEGDADDEPAVAPMRVLPSAPLSLSDTSGINVEQLRSALNSAKQSRDLPRQIQILKAIGKVQVGQNKNTEAINTYTELLGVQDGQDDDDATLETLDMLSALLVKTGNSQAAIMHTTRGLQLADVVQDPDTKLNLLLTMGDARQDLGESEPAVKAFAQALELARKNDDSQHEAIALYKLGYAYLDNGEPDEAIRMWEQAREMFRQQLKRDYEGRVLGGLGTAFAEQEKWSEAIRYYKSALHIAREVKDREEEALHLSNLGQAQVQANQLPDALLSYRQALHLAYISDDRDEIVTAIVDLVRLMMRSNRLLGICQLLLQDAENLEPADRDVLTLMKQVDEKLAQAGASGVQQAGVSGSARDYAENAYALLEG
jgi:tetratricopeptide (TPR) repeat protein